MPGVGLIILAAGESKRMGQPKQLLPLGDKSLLRHAAETALGSACWPIVVVLGAHAEKTEVEIRELPVWLVRNSDWKSGMSSSIRAGLEAICGKQLNGSESLPSAVVIMLCDQPLVSSELLNQLAAKHIATECTIVASEYGQTKGVPALFDERHFDALRNLEASEGARTLIKRHADQVQSVSFAGGIFDVDTQTHYRQLLAMGVEMNGSAIAAN